MLLERGIVIAGMEIEVPTWTNRTSQDVCQDLISAGYMLPPLKQWTKHHKYHCECKSGGCYNVRRGTVMDPPLVSFTYDASLPAQGGEFIVSPVLLSGLNRGREMLQEIWSIIVADAEWRDDLPNYHGNGTCSPSVHLHVSATLKPFGTPTDEYLYPNEDIMDALALYAPEFYALADMTEYRRGIQYRWPNRYSMHHFDSSETPFHHGFVHVRQAVPGVKSYVEWRLFEAAYKQWEYIEAGLFMAAAITRGLLDVDFVKKLKAIGFSHPYDETTLNQLSGQGNLAGILDMFNENRFYGLRELVLTNLDDEPVGQERIIHLFEQVEGAYVS